MGQTRGGSQHRSGTLKVFISYRRADTEGYAGRVYEALRRPIGAANLFMDVDSMKPGQNFVRALDDAVAGCDVMLAMIGPGWLHSEGADGGRRIDDPLDYVRLEIASALSRDKVVIPLLFTGARMPYASELPEGLRDLPTRNALVVRHDRFRADIAELVKELRRLKATKEDRAVGEGDVVTPAAGAANAADPRAELGSSLDATVARDVTRRSSDATDSRTPAAPSIRFIDAGRARRFGRGGLAVAAVAVVAIMATTAMLLRGVGNGAPAASSAVGSGDAGAVIQPGVGPSTSPQPSVAVAPSPSMVASHTATSSTGSVAPAGPAASGTPNPDYLYPSPDGTLIGIVHLETNGNFEIYVTQADGTGRRNVSNHLDQDLIVAWRPDSRRFAFVSHRDLNDEIYAVDPDGSNLLRLTSTAHDESWPAWSPDGSLILFTRAALDQTESDLWVMTPTGAKQRVVVTSPDDEGLPSWTADGRILFTRFTTSGTQDFVVNADGTGLRQLP